MVKLIIEILFVAAYTAIYVVRPLALLIKGRAKSRYYDDEFHRSTMREEPLSIIIPARNEEAILERAVLNLMSQQLGEFEIIIGENNSTDATLAIARDLERRYPGLVRVLELSPPGDVMVISWVLNQMLREARYDLICRIDADSVLKDKYSIAKLMSPMIRDRGISATGGNVKILNAADSLLLNMQSMEFMIANELNKNHLKHTSICLSGCYMGFRKSRLTNGFVEKKGISEDMTITIELSDRSKGRTMFVKNSLVYTDGMTTVKELKKQRVWWNEIGLNAFYHNRGAILNRRFGLVGINLFIIIALSCRSFLGLIARVAESLHETILYSLALFGIISLVHFLVTTLNVVCARAISEDKERVNAWGIFVFSMVYCPTVGFWRFASTASFLYGVAKKGILQMAQMASRQPDKRINLTKDI